MPRRWADQRKILRYVLAPWGKTVGTLKVDWQKEVTATAKVIHLSKVGTPEVGQLGRTDRLKVDVYALDESSAIDAAEEILEYLEGHYHYVEQDEDLGMIDDVSVESGPVPVPQYGGQPALVTATYRCETRPLA